MLIGAEIWGAWARFWGACPPWPQQRTATAFTLDHSVIDVQRTDRDALRYMHAECLQQNIHKESDNIIHKQHTSTRNNKRYVLIILAA